MQALSHVATAGKCDRQVVNTLFGTAEDNQLAVDFCVQQTAQAFNLILGFEIVLLNQRHSQLFLGNGYILRRLHVLLGQAQNRTRHGCGEQQSLAFNRQAAHNFFDIINKAHIQHFVSLVQYQEFDMVQTDSAAVDMVNQTARGTDNNLHIVAQRTDLAFNLDGALRPVNPSVLRQRTHAADTADFAYFFRNLNSQLTGRSHNQRLNMLEVGNCLHQRNTEGSGLAGTGLCLADNVVTFEHQGNSSGLNWRRLFEAHVSQGGYNFFVQL